MKKVLIILSLLLIANAAHAGCNYQYDTPKSNNNNAQITESGVKTSDIKLNGGFNSNRGYVKIKVNNGHSIRLNTPKLSNNSVLKLVNIAF